MLTLLLLGATGASAQTTDPAPTSTISPAFPPTAVTPPPTAPTTAPRRVIDRVRMPLPPELRPPELVIEPHVGFIAALVNDALCPPRVGCLFRGGFGVGIVVEQRWPAGFGLTLGYDLWAGDGEGVYELGTMHMIRFGMRYTHAYLVHALRPFADLSGGVLVFGDSFRVATVGVGGQAALGLELEITAATALSFAAATRIFLTDRFTTPADGVQRGSPSAVNLALSLEVGLRFFPEHIE